MPRSVSLDAVGSPDRVVPRLVPGSRALRHLALGFCVVVSSDRTMWSCYPTAFRLAAL